MTDNVIARPKSLIGVLDELPLGPLHRRITVVLSAIFFFELADLNTFAYAAPALRAHRGFSLDDIAHITSASFVGMAFGALIGGRVADHLGRKRSLEVSVIWFSLFSLATATVDTQSLLMGMRFLTGVGLSAMTVIAISYLSEVVAPTQRGRTQAITLAIGLLGIPVAAFLSRAVIPTSAESWRIVFIFGGLGLLGAVAACRARILADPVTDLLGCHHAGCGPRRSDRPDGHRARQS